MAEESNIPASAEEPLDMTDVEEMKTSSPDLTQNGDASKQPNSNTQAGDDSAPGTSSSHGNDWEGRSARKLQKMDSGIDVEKSPSTSMRDGLSDGDGCDSVSECFLDSTGFSHSESFKSDDSPTQTDNGVDVDALFTALNANTADFSHAETATVDHDAKNGTAEIAMEDSNVDGLEDGTDIILWPPEEATVSRMTDKQNDKHVTAGTTYRESSNVDGLEDDREIVLWPPEEATASTSTAMYSEGDKHVKAETETNNVDGYEDGTEIILWPPEEAAASASRTIDDKRVTGETENSNVDGFEDGTEIILWPPEEATVSTEVDQGARHVTTGDSNVDGAEDGTEVILWPPEDSSEGAGAEAHPVLRRRRFVSRSDSDNEEQKDGSMDTSASDKDEEDDAIVNTNPWPKHKWHALKDIRNREIGATNCIPPSLFREKVHGSLRMVQRLNLQYKMEHHEGCVNSLHFNRIGTLLASGSDDLQIVLWNWARNSPALIYDSGHRSNVFQAKFMPFSGDCAVVSCARDGQVRVAELSLTGRCKNTRKLAQHRGAAHKLALEYDSAHVFLSCGEDAVTFQIDVREEKPKRLIVTKENDNKVPLYSIYSNPVNPYEFLTSGRDPYVRVYDKRKINEDVNGGILKKFCPEHLRTGSLKTNVTCACYSYNGADIVGSYNDEDIYVFDNNQNDTLDASHRYSGHRNNATVKGVSFYGPRSEYIVSGSDCGYIYLWDKDTEHVVQFLMADECGVVNVLETHPFAPVIATSGLDHDVKIWAPTCPDATEMDGLATQCRKNRRDRRLESETAQEPEMIDGQMLWFIMNHFRRSARRRLREGGEDVSSSSNSSASDDDDDDDDDNAEEGGLLSHIHNTTSVDSLHRKDGASAH